MCLELKEKARVMTAKKDIVVYKRISGIKRTIECNNGDFFTGIINGYECSGKIHKDKYGQVWLCTDNENLDGNKSPEKFGYKYSWGFDSKVTSVIINGNKSLTINISNLETPYRHVKIKIGETYTSELFKNEHGNIDVGLHSFKSSLDALRMSYEYDVVIECIIPKGSKYYIGLFGYDDSYASDILKYVNIKFFISDGRELSPDGFNIIS